MSVTARATIAPRPAGNLLRVLRLSCEESRHKCRCHAGHAGEETAIATESGLQTYLRQINDAPLLSARQEKELARAVQRQLAAAEQFAAGHISLAEREEADQAGYEARERMVRSNLRLVVKIAKSFLNRGMSLADLVEEGNLGLLRAVEGFDPDQGVRFSTYASWWIKQAIKKALINTVQPVHIPAYMVDMINRWKLATRELQESLGRAPTLAELAERMQMPERKVRIIRRAVRAFSAPTQSPAAADGTMLSEMLPDDRTPPPDDAVATDNENEIIKTVLSQIDERAATILRLRYGLDDQEPMTLKQIGQTIGLTRERVRQIEAEARRRLSELLMPGR